jgi:hypothetical protein
MPETFSQRFCSVAPSSPTGWIYLHERRENCLVRVADGELTVLQEPEGGPVIRAPNAEVKIVTPPELRGLLIVFLEYDHTWLAVEFSGVYRAQRAAAGQRSADSGLLKTIFGLAPTVGELSTRLTCQLAADFTTALLAAGATDSPTPRVNPARPRA